MSALYMLIDRTDLRSTTILKVAPLRETIAWSKLYAAEGRKVNGPALEGRGFTKLSEEELQYLFWNVTKNNPAVNYAQLVAESKAAALAIPVDETPLAQLEMRVSQLQALQEAEANPDKPIAQSVQNPSSRPKNGTTTGQVWAIADELSFGGALASRKAVIEACEKRGINKATASTQYGKWKGSKLSEKKA